MKQKFEISWVVFIYSKILEEESQNDCKVDIPNDSLNCIDWNNFKPINYSKDKPLSNNFIGSSPQIFSWSY